MGAAGRSSRRRCAPAAARAAQRGGQRAHPARPVAADEDGHIDPRRPRRAPVRDHACRPSAPKARAGCPARVPAVMPPASMAARRRQDAMHVAAAVGDVKVGDAARRGRRRSRSAGTPRKPRTQQTASATTHQQRAARLVVQGACPARTRSPLGSSSRAARASCAPSGPDQEQAGAPVWRPAGRRQEPPEDAAAGVDQDHRGRCGSRVFALHDRVVPRIADRW